jgi:hypothetical protein
MAKDETRRVRPGVMQEDKDALAALKGIGSYAPANPNFALAKVEAARDAMNAAQELETQKLADAATARDAAAAAEWDFHNVVLGAKDQVRAQFGPDSDEWQAIGLTKKSEFARPTKSETKTAAAAK